MPDLKVFCVVMEILQYEYLISVLQHEMFQIHLQFTPTVKPKSKSFIAGSCCFISLLSNGRWLNGIIISVCVPS